MFKVVKVDLESDNGLSVFMNREDARSMNLGVGDRVELRWGDRKLIGMLHLSRKGINLGEVGVEASVFEREQLPEKVRVVPFVKPRSVDSIKKRLLGDPLQPEEIRQIIFDLMDHKITDVEAAYFVASSYVQRFSPEEEEALSRAIIDAGSTISFDRHPVMDKHCIGGVPGNRTTPIVVPIVAAAGYTFPKTSSRAITSPAGTADVVEVFANVSFSSKEVKEIVEGVGACMVWGGAVDLAPADDLLLKLRYPLRLDPLAFLLSSILAKKRAIGADRVLIDIPLGAKVKSMEEARNLAKRFDGLGERLGMEVTSLITDGDQPIGHGVGPALEARDVINVLMGKGPEDLKEKALSLAGKLLELAGEKDGEGLARRLLESGKAYEKFREIVEAQEGDPDVKPEDISVGEHSIEVKAQASGVVEYDSTAIARLARLAGAPSIKSAGLYLNVLPGKKAKEGQIIMTVYTPSEDRLEQIRAFLRETAPVVSKNMVIEVL